MAKPLAHLLARTEEDWLIGYSTEKLADLAQERYQELQQFEAPATVLLAEKDPIKFLASFLAACSTHCHIFLCNPDWIEAEWQQVFELVNPDLIWGHVPSQPENPIQSSNSKLKTQNSKLILIPTGGTSGKIRFAMHTWETLAASVEGFRDYFEVDRIHSFCVLPLYHVSGLMQFMRSFLSNGKLLILPWKTLETGQVSIDTQDFFLSLVPTQLQRLLTHPTSQLKTQNSKLKTILLGGAPAWTALLEEARSRQLPLAPTYGMTETASQIATLKPEDFLQNKQGCGQSLPHAHITIRDENGECLEVGKIGKITIQTQSLMLGYYPQLLEQAFYQPDDLGFLDFHGYLHIIGRNSHKIITGGENVFPAEVEAAILATKLVKDVCVMGTSDQLWGQVVTAVYVPQNSDISSDQIQISLEEKLSKFKRPKSWIALETLPRNPQGKINHEQLRQILAQKADTPPTPATA
jgi:o-succinylbenzoate---CoA ligase